MTTTPAITSFSGANHFLSNFYSARVCLDGVIYPSVEHAYQAAKTLDPVQRLPLQNPRLSAGQAKRIGRSLALREDWAQIRLPVMRELIADKFARGSPLAAQLIATGAAELIEGNRWGDTFWGVDLRANSASPVGANHLGRLLMQRRSELARL